jgi:GNAT superfamily N-acetyltransferase
MVRNDRFNEYELSTDKSRIDHVTVWRFLHGSYWAEGIPQETVSKSIEHSLVFGAYVEGAQVGFARVITDRTTFAYLADVFVAPEHRGAGLGKALMHFIMDDPNVQGLRRFVLATRDAHGLYARYGFTLLAQPDRSWKSAILTFTEPSRHDRRRMIGFELTGIHRPNSNASERPRESSARNDDDQLSAIELRAHLNLDLSPRCDS